MGLFEVFKNTNESKIAFAYDNQIKNHINDTFPNGKIQAAGIINSLAKIYGINLENVSARKYQEILQTYSDVWFNQVIYPRSDEDIIKVLQERHKSLVTNKDIAREVLSFVMLNMNDNSFFLDSDSDWQSLNDIVDMYKEMETNTKLNADAEKKNLDDPWYGLIASKPIYTQGVKGAKLYLMVLKASTGETLIWKRIGSTKAEGINGMIDIYESTLSSGKPYKTLYINICGSSDSKIVPIGFTKFTIKDIANSKFSWVY